MAGLSKLKIGRGALKGRYVEFRAHPELRPTLARTRESIFSILAPRAADFGFIDLCAGSGIMGFEAASMGFQPVYLLDTHRETVRQLQENQRALSADLNVAVQPAVQLHRLGLARQDWVVFADPPYRDRHFHAQIMAYLAVQPFLGGGSLYVAECGPDSLLQHPPGWDEIVQKRYGRVHVRIFELRPTVTGSE